MNRSLTPHLVRDRTVSISRSLRRGSSHLLLEFLENRQMLSVSSAPVNLVAVPSTLTASPLATNRIPSGLTPSQVRQAYGLGQVAFQGGAVAGNGAGQTIAIVTANDDPTIGSDLRQFDSQMGLPAPPSFIKYLQVGLTRPDAGWSLETSLDVEWAHAMAPGANLVLVEAKSANFSDLFNAVNFARSINGVVAVSMSWGAPEFYGENSLDGLFTTPAGHIGGSNLPGGVTFIAASGDGGAWSGVSYPAASPNVLAVGATSLYLGAGSSYMGEVGWVGSTGGFSVLEPAPAYQGGAQFASSLYYGLRTVPDVAAVGDPATGVAIYDSVSYAGHSGWFAVGGTSASAPQWAGIIAIADQGLALAGRGSLANAQAALYSIPSSSFHDVTTGFNGYSATSGYDLVTGLGTPVANRVVAGLLASQGVYNVAGFPSPAPGSILRSVTAHASDIVSSATNSSTPGPISFTITPTNSTSLFPVNIVVIIVPVGSTEVVVILPPAPAAASPFASGSHFVEPQSSLSLLEPGQTANPLSVLAKFGQGPPIGLPFPMYSRINPDPEPSAPIDLVLPFDGPAQKAAFRPAARTTLPDGPTMSSTEMLSILHVLDLEGPAQASQKASSRNPAPIAPASSRDGRAQHEDDESRTGSSTSSVAGVAALAGASYWVTLRDPDTRKRNWTPLGLGRSQTRNRRRTVLPPG